MYDRNGEQVTQSNPETDTFASISATVAGGHYFLEVSGVGNNLTPYSDYGSLGQYFISGTIVPGVVPDTTAPTPNPMTWLVVPSADGSANSISMEASVASDDNGGAVQYDFICVAGGTGCVESGWQASNSYIATGLQASTDYSYQVKARDVAGNQTSVSVTAAATTAAPLHTTAPAPDPMTWFVLPNAGGSADSITMTATTATDAAGGIQYHFVCTAGGIGCVDAPWQASPIYTATGLQSGTTYSYKVQAEDAYGNMNSFSQTKSATTAVALPATPTNLTGSKTKSTVSLSWDAVTGAASYEIFRCSVTSSGCTYSTKALKTVTTNAYSYAATRTVYGYKVRSVNSAGKSSFSNEVRF